jgi:hypothetical protein
MHGVRAPGSHGTCYIYNIWKLPISRQKSQCARFMDPYRVICRIFLQYFGPVGPVRPLVTAYLIPVNNRLYIRISLRQEDAFYTSVVINIH